MDDDALLARLNAALREAQHLRAEALRVQREAAARLAEIRWTSTGLSEAMDRGLAQSGQRPQEDAPPARSAASAGPVPRP